jgi:hypothetical protein
MNILLSLADLLGLDHVLGGGGRMIFFTTWPKDQRVRYWASDVDMVMIVREPEPGHDWYSIRVFEKDGNKAEHTISKSTFLDLQKSDLRFDRSPKLGLVEENGTE